MWYAIFKKIKKMFPGLISIIRPLYRCINPKGLCFTAQVSPEDYFVKPNFDKEQFFFSKSTAEYLTHKLSDFNYVCCLCTPRLACEIEKSGKKVRLLDIDDRFSFIRGYQPYDISRGEKLNEDFDAVFVDAPFSLSEIELLHGIECVCNGCKGGVTLCVVFPAVREASLLRTFAPYKLKRVVIEELKWNNIRAEYSDQYGLYASKDIFT